MEKSINKGPGALIIPVPKALQLFFFPLLLSLLPTVTAAPPPVAAAAVTSHCDRLAGSFWRFIMEKVSPCSAIAIRLSAAGSVWVQRAFSISELKTSTGSCERHVEGASWQFTGGVIAAWVDSAPPCLCDVVLVVTPDITVAFDFEDKIS
ncbi:hypothetical protein F511_23935 [Dorcoceras hygrometricum]|uniref:Uncharacterized protein n=1 Tax=Dorcoceras hygrometricum TaxID=472368 RepID=A0A2Z7ABD4_9LAMI|nr:hypothetical protein F511_23935 [Dorcoceras hygrometricum]